MGLYAKYILPRLIDVSMRNREVVRLRAEWLPRASGDVLEVGIGSGLNLPFYSSEVPRIYGVDPSFELQRMARKRASAPARAVDFICQPAEDPIPLADASIDSVVMTWTLCSVADPAQVLRQVRRVLKPGGKLIFIEHGRAPDPGVAAWQDRLTPVWKRISGGCRLNRQPAALLEAAGFHVGELKTAYLSGPRVMTYTYQGVARRTVALPAGRSPVFP